MTNNGLFSDDYLPHSYSNSYSFNPAPDPDYLSWDPAWGPEPVNPIGTNSPEFASQQEIGIAKFEESTMGQGFPKDEPADNRVDLKVPLVNGSVRKDSRQLVNLLLGDDRSLSLPGVRLDDEVFALSNRESQPLLFPVRMLSNII